MNILYYCIGADGVGEAEESREERGERREKIIHVAGETQIKWNANSLQLYWSRNGFSLAFQIKLKFIWSFTQISRKSRCAKVLVLPTPTVE